METKHARSLRSRVTGRRYLRTTFALIAFCLIVALATGSALAHVKDWYEWCKDPATGKPKRSLKVWVDPAAGSQWAGWTQEAIDNWNNAGTGWTLTLTSQIEGADVTVHTAPIPPRRDGRVPVGRANSDFDGNTGEVIGVGITANSNVPWGTSGDNVTNPVKLLKHELGHAMRLDHSELGNLMDEIVGLGDHGCEPNLDDIEEAKEAFSTTRAVPEPRPQGDKMHMASGSSDLTLAAVDYSGVAAGLGAPVVVYPMEGIMLPDPLAVPHGFERVIAAAGVFPLEAEFTAPAELRLLWTAASVAGTGVAGELHEYLAPPVVAGAMAPVVWIKDPADPAGGTWALAPVGFTHDVAGSSATLAITGGGVYGLAAPAEGPRPPVQGGPAFSDMGAAANPVVAAALTELRALDVYRGYPDGTAGPGRALNRLEFFTIGVRLAGGEAAAATLAGSRPAFSDAIPAWGWGYVNQAVASGLALGYPDGTFRPLQNVTGNEALAVLIRVLGPEGDAIARTGPWPQGYVDAATELGLLDEAADLVSGDLTPWLDGAIDRGEMAVLTRAAVWTTARYSGEMGYVIAAPSIAASAGWWRGNVSVALRSGDARRWLLARAVQVPGYGREDRLEVREYPYLAPDAELPDAGETVLVMAKGPTVYAVMAGPGMP